MFALILTASLAPMLSMLITVVVFLIVAGVLFWAVNKLCAAFGVPEPIRTVIIVLLVVVVVVALVYYFLGAGLVR